MLRSDDPLPQNVIRFSEAFERFFRTIEPRGQELEAGAGDALAAYEQGGFTETQKLKWHAAIDALNGARIAAWSRWRSALESGKFVPCIRDPDKDVILELDKRGWGGSPGLGPHCFINDFICPDDLIQPGPLAAIGGKLRPVFFVKDAFEAALAAMSGSAAGGGRGRKPSYDPERVRTIVFDEMNHHGEFLPDDPDWRSQADLERAVHKALGSAPAESTVRKLIVGPLAEWRRSQGR